MTAALAFSTFQLVIAAFSPLSSQVTRSLHVAFLLLLTFLVFPPTRRDGQTTTPWYDWVLALGAFALGFYHWAFEADLIQRAGQPITADLIVGTVVVVLLFEAARRVIGLALPIVSGVFLAYGLFGEYLPGVLAHRPFGYDQIVGQLYLATGGIYGIPTLVSATYIFLFILFGSFLEHSGMMRLFNDVALGTVGHAKGGPAKVAVVSSGFMGMNQRVGRGQRADGGVVHDSADDAVRVFVRLCRGHGDDGKHGRADYASSHGCGRVHHG